VAYLVSYIWIKWKSWKAQLLIMPGRVLQDSEDFKSRLEDIIDKESEVYQFAQLVIAESS
jgi:hypothetical protein